jgi:uncharacterized membrane protein
MNVENMLNDVLKKSWNLFKNQYVTLIIGTLIGIIGMIFIITIPPLVFGIYFMCINAAKGKKVEISDVFSGFDYFFTSWGMFILMFIAITIGLALLVIPGILLMIMFQYAVVIAINEKKGAISALERSYEIAKKNFSFSLVFWVLISVITSIGSLIRIGLIVTVPFTFLCTCLATNRLTAKKK